MKPRQFAILLVIACLAGCAGQPMEFVRVDPAHRAFMLARSHQRFVPWGNNYAVNQGWNHLDWRRIARDFDDFRAMRANVARVHLQVPEYMDGPAKPDIQALANLSHLLKLAEQKKIYLDITGLASYDIRHRAGWYDAMDDRSRWATQACFWEAIARVCAKSPAVFCYDLINEPVVQGARKNGWYAGRMGNYEFVQRLSLGNKSEPANQIAIQWTRLTTAAIRKYDRVHLITIGMLPAWGPPPQVVGPELDFISVHIYPAAGKVNDSIRTLKRFDIGKPIVVEETFPLSCGVADEKAFLLQSRGIAAGWMGQYPSQTPAELRELKRAGKMSMGQAAYLAWIELFRDVGPEMLGPSIGK